jgi:hypothetical protein
MALCKQKQAKRSSSSFLHAWEVAYIVSIVNERAAQGPESDLLRSQYQALLEISQSIALHRDLEQLFRDLGRRLHGVVEFDFANLMVHEPNSRSTKSYIVESPGTVYTCPPG